MSVVGSSQSVLWASASAARPGYRFTIFLDTKLTWKVILPSLTVRVPLPSQASLAWNMPLSVSNSAVYTPSGRAAVSVTSDAAELAALEGASEETADGAVEEAPQPAREAASSTVTTERESICLQRIEKYLNISESKGKNSLRVSVYHNPAKNKNCPKRSLPPGNLAVVFSRSENQWQPWCGQRTAPEWRALRPDRRSDSPQTQMRRKR